MNHVRFLLAVYLFLPSACCFARAAQPPKRPKRPRVILWSTVHVFFELFRAILVTFKSTWSIVVGLCNCLPTRSTQLPPRSHRTKWKRTKLNPILDFRSYHIHHNLIFPRQRDTHTHTYTQRHENIGRVEHRNNANWIENQKQLIDLEAGESLATIRSIVFSFS